MKVSKKEIRKWEKAMVPLMHVHAEQKTIQTRYGDRVITGVVNHKRRVRRIIKTSENETVMQDRLAAHLAKFGAAKVVASGDALYQHHQMMDRLTSPSK